MKDIFPKYLDVVAAGLGQGTPVKVRVLGDMASIARDLADAMKAEILLAREQGRAATLIVPVGPVDHWPLLAKSINKERINCRDVAFIQMDEYLTDKDEWVSESHPLSFRAYMKRAFYDLLDTALAPLPENRVCPDPRDCGAVQRFIDARGGVDATFGGIGINGHIAFNEPPELESWCPLTPSLSPGGGEGARRAGEGDFPSVEQFAALPTRALPLTRETRTINSVTVGGEINVIPRRAVTVGMKEILASRRVRLYCNRPWQSAVVRRVLHGPVTPACPASLIRLHADARVTVADYVAAVPDIRLR
ncbi:MAG: glucosamine-6-phosphate isomerase [Verrucomicrobia bacterium]|nr:glucosamine-6-phosphate isomerase [Verrucomicrobiota bacterium]